MIEGTRPVEEWEPAPSEDSSEDPAFDKPTEAPQPTAWVAPTSIPIPIALAIIDAALTNTMEGSIAHNAPDGGPPSATMSSTR
ncbi:MAG: hypothetical protein ACOC8X_02025 [Chloroflexota bacterium]